MSYEKNIPLKNQFTVDIVIPVRGREEYDVIDRLKLRSFYSMPQNFNIFIVDYGSKESISQQLENICNKEGYQYYYADTGTHLFNLADARNIAILNSKADYLIYEDIDLVSHKDFYIWINQQIQSMIIERNWPFLVVPVIYVSENHSKYLYEGVGRGVYDSIISEIYNPESQIIDFFAVASSYIICSRKKSKLIGGFDEEFKGWGFEDSDFELRFLRHVNIYKPRDFYKYDTRPYTEQTQWSGWKVLFRIFADVMSFKGIYSFHIWHHQPAHRSQSVIKRNRKVFRDNSNRYATALREIHPLHNENEPTDLFLSDDLSLFNIDIFSFFDNPLLVDEDDILINDIADLIAKFKVRNVVLGNPYDKETRLQIYYAFKKTAVNIYVLDKGALPNSIYIDSAGFCIDSDSYVELNFVNRSDKSEITKTNEYIDAYRAMASDLCLQEKKIDRKFLKERILAAPNKTKVLFIYLQDSSDSRTKFFCGDIENYENYLCEMQVLCNLLEGTEWAVIYKNESLAADVFTLKDALCVDEYDINILLEACNCISVLNSEIGVLAMIYSKPVYYFGEVFFGFEGINKSTNSAESLYKELMHNNFYYDKSKAVKFLSYLINNYYSFTTPMSYLVDSKNDEIVNRKVNYEVLRIDGTEVYLNQKPIIDLRRSILFDRYRTDDYLSRAANLTRSHSKLQDDNHHDSVDIELIARKIESIDRLQGNKLSNKGYTLKNKLKKLINDPNQFFADYFLKKTKK